MALVDVGKVAQALNLSQQRVQQLVHEGMQREARGRYDVIRCMLFYVRYLQQAIEKRTGSPSDGVYISEREERLRLLRADADLREMTLAKERGQVMALLDIEVLLTDLVLTTKARILGVPARLAPEIIGETSRVMVQAKAEKAFKEALAHLDRVRLPQPAGQQ